MVKEAPRTIPRTSSWASNEDEPGPFLRGLPSGRGDRARGAPDRGAGRAGALSCAVSGAEALYSSDEFAKAVGLQASPLDDLVAFHTVFGKTVPDISLNAVANLGYAEAMAAAGLAGRYLAVGLDGDPGLKETSSGATGVVWVRTQGVNQQGDVVLEYVRWVMVRKRRREVVVPTHVPDLAAVVDPGALVVPQGLDFSRYDFALAGGHPPLGRLHGGRSDRPCRWRDR